MASLRYAIAVILIVAIPAAIVYWLLIHPFVRFWRRLGIGRSYAVICAVIAGVMGGMFLSRERLLTVDPGTNYPLAALGLICLALAGWLLKVLRRQLPTRVLIGVPELAQDHQAGPPITEGIYARIRHPRYVQMTLALWGYALIANYPAAYGAFLLWCAGIYAVVILEERELRARFGEAYQEYCRRVPRFVPRFGKRA
jgi:protein-S-isoprenylcysteine O-methyltransferase Ste14